MKRRMHKYPLDTHMQTLLWNSLVKPTQQHMQWTTQIPDRMNLQRMVHICPQARCTTRQGMACIDCRRLSPSLCYIHMLLRTKSREGKTHSPDRRREQCLHLDNRTKHCTFLHLSALFCTKFWRAR